MRRTVRPLQRGAIVRVEASSRGGVGNRGHQDPLRVVAQAPPHERRDLAPRSGLGAKRGEGGGEVEGGGGGLPAVQRDGEDPGEELERIREAGVVAFAQLALDPGERAVRDRRVETVTRRDRDGGHHPGFDLPGEVRIAPEDAATQRQPRTSRLHGVRPECDRRGAGRLQQRVVKRRVRPLQQTRGEKPCTNRLDRFPGLAETPPERDAGAGRLPFPGAILRVVNHGSSRRPERRDFERPGTRHGIRPPA